MLNGSFWVEPCRGDLHRAVDMEDRTRMLQCKIRRWT